MKNFIDYEGKTMWTNAENSGFYNSIIDYLSVELCYNNRFNDIINLEKGYTYKYFNDIDLNMVKINKFSPTR